MANLNLWILWGWEQSGCLRLGVPGLHAVQKDRALPSAACHVRESGKEDINKPVAKFWCARVCVCARVSVCVGVRARVRARPRYSREKG